MIDCIERQWQRVDDRFGEALLHLGFGRAAIDFLGAQVANPFYPLLPKTNLASTTVARSQLLKPYPQFSGVSAAQNIGYSWYHSLQVRTEKRFSKGYTLQAVYTYSKFMQATEFQNASDPLPYRVISDSDRPHVFTLSGVWEIPYRQGRHFGSSLPKPVNFILGGWQTNGTIVRQSGAPLGFGIVARARIVSVARSTLTSTKLISPV